MPPPPQGLLPTQARGPAPRVCPVPSGTWDIPSEAVDPAGRGPVLASLRERGERVLSHPRA